MKRRNGGSMLRRLLLVLSAAMVAVFVSAAVGSAVTQDEPEHTKTLVNNHDGTYTLSLDVKGATRESTTDVSANVIVVMDISGSMNNPAGSTTRLAAGKKAVNGLAQELLSKNTSANPDSVQMALVTFSTTATTNISKTTSSTAFSRAVNGLSASGGTNWEDALQEVENISFGDNDPTYVIFCSDGNPTFRNTRGDYWFDDDYYDGVYGTGQENATNVERCYNYARDDARALVNQGKRLYTIGVFGNVDQMKSLTNYAYTGSDTGIPDDTYYYAASDSAALNKALKAILQEIEKVGIGKVTVKDGTTSQVTTSSGEICSLLSVDEKSFVYTLTDTDGTKHTILLEDEKISRIDGETKNVKLKGGKILEIGSPMPEASFKAGAVTWDLTHLGLLENGVTYRVSFLCYPSQDTNDLITSLKNKCTYSEIPSAMKKYFRSGLADTDVVTYDDLTSEVQKYLTSDYKLTTNTEATLTYDDTGTETDETQNPVKYINPTGVPLSVDSVKITKKWVNDVDSREGSEVRLNVIRDGKTETPSAHVTLNSGNRWSASTYTGDGLAVTVKDDAGKITGIKVYNTGHDYDLQEPKALGYFWEIDADTIHPMRIDGKLYTLAKVSGSDVPSGMEDDDTYFVSGDDTYYRIGSSVYRVLFEGEENANFNITNYRQSSLEVTKKVTSDADAEIPEAQFEYTFSAVCKDGRDYVFGVRDEKGNLVTGLNPTNSIPEEKDGKETGRYQAGSGVTVTVKIKAGWTIRLLDLPVGSTYSVTESAPGGSFRLDTLESSVMQAENPPKQATAAKTDGRTASGTIDCVDTQYHVEYTNKYFVREVSVSKSWNDAQNQDGIRPDSVRVKLYADGEAVKDADGNDLTITLSADNGWKSSFKGLPRYSGEKEIQYTVEEVKDNTITGTDGPNTYKTAVIGNMTDGYSLTNTHTPETVDISGTKTWKDDEYQGKTGYTRPDSIQVTLTGTAGDSSAAVYTDTKKVTADDGWKYSWKNLAKYSNGKEIKYTVTETALSGFDTAYDGYNITNTPMKKAEIDAPVSLTLFKKDSATGNGLNGAVFTLTDSGQGSRTYTTGTDGKVSIEFTKAGTYTLTETTAPEGYEPNGKSYEVTVTRSGVVKVEFDGQNKVWNWFYNLLFSPEIEGNTLTVENTTTTADVNVTKKWDDNGDKNKVRPDSVIMQLYQTVGGKTQKVDGKTLTLTANDAASGDSNVWKGTFEKLPAYVDGNKIEYTIKELNSSGTAVNDGEKADGNYTVFYSGDTLTVTNSYTNAKANLKVKKSFNGWDVLPEAEFTFRLAAVTDGAPMPESGKVKATKNSPEAAFGSITYSKAGTYEYTLTEVKGDLAGVTYSTASHKVLVTVTEARETHKLSADVKYDGESSLTVTNTFRPVTLSGDKALKVTKKVEGRNASEAFQFSLTPAEDNPQGASIAKDGNTAVTRSSIADGSSDTVKFGDVSFTRTGTYKFVVRETNTEVPQGWTYANGEKDAKTVTVTVTKDADGQLAAAVTDNNPVFTNRYEAKSVTLGGDTALQVTKKVTGWNAKEAFSFRLTPAADNPEGAVIADGGDTATTKSSSLAAGSSETVSFGDVTFTKAGTYVFNVRETNPDPPAASGWSYDKTSHPITVVVTDNGKGQLEASTVENGKDTNKPTVVNSYSAKPVTLGGSTPLQVTKNVTGHDALSAFTFRLTPSDNNPEGAVMADGGDTATTKSSSLAAGSSETVSFGDVTFTKVGIYTFAVKETTTLSKGGWTYDNGEKTITVKVTDDGTGTLKAEVTGNNPTVTNSYEAKSVTLGGDTALKVRKKVTGHDSTEAFQFSLTPAEDNPQGASIAKDGDTAKTTGEIKAGEHEDVSFGDVTFTKAGTYRFTVKETNEKAPNGWTYANKDADAKTITVTVTDDGQGQLHAEADKKPEFVNSYKAEPAVLEGDNTALKVTKAVDGHKAVEPFTFQLSLKSGAAENVEISDDTAVTGNSIEAGHSETLSFEKVTISKAGEYTFAVKETTTPSKGGWTYDNGEKVIKVTVEDDHNGHLIAHVDGNDQTVTNSFKAATLEDDAAVVGTKTLYGRDMYEGEKYEFTIEGNNDVTRTAVDSGEITIEKNRTEVAGGKNGESTSFSFGKLTFTEAGEYEFAVKEIAGQSAGVAYDGEPKVVKVKVTKGDGGQLVATAEGNKPAFENRYTATGSITPSGTKKLLSKNGASLSMPAGAFTFDIRYADGDQAKVLSGQNAAGKDAAIQFGALEYSTAGDNSLEKLVEKGYAKKSVENGRTVYTIDYKVTENEPENAALKLQPNTQTESFSVKVTVNPSRNQLSVESDDAKKLDFTNRYEANDAVINVSGLKTMSGDRPLKAGEFTFVLKGEDNAPMPKNTEVKNGEGGAVNFGDITFTKDDLGDSSEKTFTYTVSETGNQPGVTNDGQKTFKVTVKDDGKGLLEARTEPERTLFTFANRYKPTPGDSSVTDDISITKKLTGRDLAEDEFTFQLKDETGRVVDTAKNKADGSVTFPKLKFTEAGTYTYTVSEVSGEEEHMTYDGAEYKVTATVTDAFDGKPMSVSWNCGVGEKITFNNTYTKPIPTPCYLDPPLHKVVKGNPAKDGKFTFVLKGKSTTAEAGSLPMPKGSSGQTKTITVRGAGSYEFGVIRFTEPGTYVYTMTEKDNRAAGYTYDTSEYTLTCIVTESRDNRLHVKAEVTKDGNRTGKAKFTNRYKKPEPKKNGPDTGDRSDLTLMILLGATSAAALGALWTYRRKTECD
ncbi:Spy0128 family protein [Hornefia butyriciproducens]|uniref:Spy0128 family protein n=1 Tax=Hornefia butyriciproducens TaxID=2652293 RepID=UPI002A91D87A|nr:FctA domain-containing protein [Hornefia butyriciproducens]MDY5463818.1 FctA domain-containing protein [Hornefia butyriciproducens]